MTSKVLSFVLIIALVGLHSSAQCGADPSLKGVWRGSPTGKCFDTLDEYLGASYGEYYKGDENIRVLKVEGGKRKGGVSFLWVIDMTPGVNITRVLFEEFSSGRVCAVLYSPLSSSIDFRLAADGTLPKYVVAKNTPSPGFSATRVTFKLDPSARSYFPYRCQSISAKGVIKNINCDSAFLD